MCGFVGFVHLEPRPLSADKLQQTVRKMSGAIVHRGPDAEGIFVDLPAQLGIGFRRLAIRDLTAAGHQPMEAASQRYVIAFNGEIYNSEEVRAQLVAEVGPIQFRGHSDTEVLLAGIDHWGLEATIQKCVGMFAIALWDRRMQTLSLVRDRFGEKPLYFGYGRGAFLFGSELKALRQHPMFDGTINRQSLALYLRHNYLPAPHSIYQQIQKLTPGTILTLTRSQLVDHRLPEPQPYWSYLETLTAGQSDPFSGALDEAVDQLEQILLRTIDEQMISDVPLGAFLSGGLDSSLVVALMQSRKAQRVRSFSIGFHEKEFDEAPHAKAIARHLGTDHTEMYVTPQDALDVVPLLPAMFDEPFADSSQIPTYLVAKMARQHVTVSLSGDAGDEIFGGYSRYVRGLQFAKIEAIPDPIRKTAAWALGQIPGVQSAGSRSLLRKVYWASALLKTSSFEDAYRLMVSAWKDPLAAVDSEAIADSAFDEVPRRLSGQSPLRRMMALDTLTYLPDDILVKVDRTTMAVSLEARAPFLDHRVNEFACRLPEPMLLQSGQGKQILRKLLARYVPTALTDRPKQGFGIPVDRWVRGPLLDWAESLLEPRLLADQGFFRCSAVRQVWEEHKSGRANRISQLWPILMFQAWHRETSAGPSETLPLRRAA